jgi:hypothetical protein
MQDVIAPAITIVIVPRPPRGKVPGQTCCGGAATCS